MTMPWVLIFIFVSELQLANLDQWNEEGVATALLRSFSRSGSFHEVQEALQHLPFQVFQEAASDDINYGLTMSQFENKVLGLARDFKLNDDTKQSILEGQYAEVNKEVLKKFVFTKGQAGEVVQGLVATMRRADGTIDIGHVIHRLDFQLAPEIIRHEKKRRRFFRTRKRVRYESRMRTLSHVDEELLIRYVEHKLSDGLEHVRQKAQAVGEGTCTADSCH